MGSGTVQYRVSHCRLLAVNRAAITVGNPACRLLRGPNGPLLIKEGQMAKKRIPCTIRKRAKGELPKRRGTPPAEVGHAYKAARPSGVARYTSDITG